jgi:ABC-2 type transport system ATP-binding protein
MAGESVLECRGLRRRFCELVAVDGVGFHIGPGETYGLLGPNGAGKTTSISMIAGLLESDAGEVLVAGEPMTTRSVRAKNAIGYVPQDLAIYPDLTGRENLMFFARLYSMPTPEAKRRTDEVLALTGLADRAGDQTKQYSGGMKRRLNIGIGLLHQPKLLILDEPTVGVDPQSRNAILESVEGLSGGSPTPPPQAWGNDAFARLVGHGASIAGILPQLGVLAAYAAVLLTLAAWRLRRVLSC